jgi:hypothetical protein
MPAIEFLPAGLAPGVETDTLPNTNAGGTRGEFEQAMSEALLPDGKNAAERVLSQLGFPSPPKRLPTPPVPAPASPKLNTAEPAVAEKNEPAGELSKPQKTVPPAADEEKFLDPVPPFLISLPEPPPVPLIAFSAALPGNFFLAAKSSLATGGERAAAAPLPPTALAGASARASANVVANAQNFSPQIPSLPAPAVKLPDLMVAVPEPASNISNPASAPPIFPLVPGVTAAPDLAPSPTAMANPQSSVGLVGPGAPPPAAFPETALAEVSILLPSDFQRVVVEAVGTPQPDDWRAALAPGSVKPSPQEIPGPSAAKIQAAAGTMATVQASAASVAVNFQTEGRPEKNLAEILIPSAVDQTVLAESLPVRLTAGMAQEPSTVADQISGRAESAAEDSAPVPAMPANTGTGVASTLPAMKKSDKVEFYAGGAGQKLPVAGPTRVAAGALAAVLPELPPRRPEFFASDFSPAFNGADSENNLGAAVAAPSVNMVALPTLSEARLQAVERTHELVAAHALRLVESKADAWSIVLKPGAGTELSLELRQRNGVVEAQAFLSQGDHQFLNQHWADLQARLELRGVKLGPLGGEDSFTSGGNFSQQRPPSRDEETERAAAFAEFAAVSGGATARSAAHVWGWESWA